MHEIQKPKACHLLCLLTEAELGLGPQLGGVADLKEDKTHNC